MPRKAPVTTRFKPGTSGNPGGRPKLSPELKKQVEITTNELKRLVAKYFRMEEADLTAVLKDPKTTMLDKYICAVIDRCAREGDPWRAEVLFNRILGRVTEKIEVQHPEPVMIQRASGEVIEVGVQDAQVEEEKGE